MKRRARALRIDARVLATSPAPDCLARHLYVDNSRKVEAIKLMPGEYGVSTSGQMLTTVLGSCVSACIRDVRLGLGGMNHFMLPDADTTEVVSVAARYGVFAMETLINHLLKLGAQRSSLEAKVFGGGAVLEGMNHINVGDRNAAFALDYLRTERIPVTGSDLGNVHPRKVLFFPDTGRVLMKFLGLNAPESLREQERAYQRQLVRAPVSGDIELF
ncbi:MAG: chemoreceptor glutamine deamidase CheD [Burkholderiaceae bacterium]